MRIALGEPCLVVLIGASGSGKSTFAARHFLPTETVSSDFCRALVADDANDQDATTDAFAVLHEITSRRLARGRITVIDATNVQKEARAALVAIAREHDLFAAAIVMRASMATASVDTAPAASAARIPASTAVSGSRRCSNSTSINTRVPAASPCLARTAAQNASWTAVNRPAARAWASAVDPGNAPGLPSRISR